MKNTFYCLLMMFTFAANGIEFFGGFGLPLGTKLSDIDYTEVEVDMSKRFKIKPPKPMKILNQYFVGVQPYSKDKRIQHILGEAEFDPKLCRRHKEKITQQIKANFKIYSKQEDEVLSIFVVSQDELGNNRISVACYDNLLTDGKTLLSLAYSAQILRLPNINSLFGIELNKKVPNLDSVWEKYEWIIANYRIQEADFGFDNVSLMVSPNTGQTRSITAGRKQENKKSCEVQREKLIGKLEDRFLVDFLEGKQNEVLSVNDKVGISVNCRNVNGDIILGLTFYQHEYGLEPETTVWD